jgi:uncharacterized protein (DUF58 family)
MRSFPLLDPQLISRLPPIALKALGVVEGAITGLHQSPHHGQSIEFNQHKEYTPGDEVRHIDWKLFAKSDRYYVKQFEQETNLKAYLLLDASASMAYPDGQEDDRPSKFSYGSIIALSMAYLLFRQGDAVGLFTFHKALRNLMPPRNRPSYLLPLAQALEAETPREDTALLPVLQQMAELMRRRSMMVLISDLFIDLDEITPLLTQFAAQGHDLIIFHILDRDELGFPFREQTLFEDLEQNAQSLQVDALAIRPHYLEELNKYLQQIKRVCHESGIEYWQIDTSTPPEQILRRFLLQRSHSRRRIRKR